MTEPEFMSFLVPGLIYGLLTGIALATGAIASIIVKRNLVSKVKGKYIPTYSRNGLEVFNSNLSDNFGIGTLNISSKKKSGIGYIDNEDRDNLEYFKRNLDLNYEPPKRQKPEIDKVTKRPINRRTVNRNKYTGNIRTDSINEGVAAASASAAKVAEDLKEAEKESLSE